MYGSATRKSLLKDKICTIADVIATRDDIMLTLIHKYDLEKSIAFKIMEDVRKGRRTQARIRGNDDFQRCARMVYRIVQEDKIYVPEGTRRRICYQTHSVSDGIKYIIPLSFMRRILPPRRTDSKLRPRARRHGCRFVSELEKLKKLGTEMSQKEAANYDALQLVSRKYYAPRSQVPSDRSLQIARL